MLVGGVTRSAGPTGSVEMPEIERWEFGNPESVAIRREDQTCKWCARLDTLTLFGRRTDICILGRPAGKRCKRYQEKNT